MHKKKKIFDGRQFRNFEESFRPEILKFTLFKTDKVKKDVIKLSCLDEYWRQGRLSWTNYCRCIFFLIITHQQGVRFMKEWKRKEIDRAWGTGGGKFLSSMFERWEMSGPRPARSRYAALLAACMQYSTNRPHVRFLLPCTSFKIPIFVHAWGMIERILKSS